jgi:hypothetical protein
MGLIWSYGLQYVHNEIDWHKIHKIVGTMDFWSWKLKYVIVTTMKWMTFGLVLWWILKLFRGLFFIFKCNNEIKIEGFDSYLMKFMSYGFYSVKSKHIFQ